MEKRRTVTQRVLPRRPVQQLRKGYPVLTFSLRCRNHIPGQLVQFVERCLCDSRLAVSVYNSRLGVNEVVQVSLERSPRWSHTREVSMRSSTDRQMKENGVRGIRNSRTPSNSSTGRPASGFSLIIPHFLRHRSAARFAPCTWGLAIDCRHTNLASALYWGGYVRQGRLSGKGFQKCKSLAGFNRFRSRFPVPERLPTRNFARDFRSLKVIGYTVAVFVLAALPG